MGKCADCKRPKVAWVKSARRLADELLAAEPSFDTDFSHGKVDGLMEAGVQLDKLLKEIEQ